MYFYPVMESVHIRFYTVNPKQERDGDWDTTWRTLPNVLLERPSRGAWECLYSGGRVVVPAGHLLVVPVACRHRLRKCSAGKMLSDWSYVSWHAGDQEIRTADTPCVFKPAFTKTVTACFQAATSQAQAIAAQAAVMRILSAFITEKPVQAMSTDDRVQRVIKFMHLHIAVDLQRDDLAAVCHLSATRFHDVFMAATGIAPMRYLTRLRLQLAQSLLRQPEMSIARIASECGFQSQAYFNRVFKRAFAQAPSQYRRSCMDLPQ